MKVSSELRTGRDYNLYYSKLAGDLPALAEEELLSLVESYGYNIAGKYVEGRYLLFQTNCDIATMKRIYVRAGLVSEIGIIQGEVEELVNGRDVTLWEEHGISDDIRSRLKKALSIREVLGKDRLVLRVINSKGEKIIGMVVGSYKFNGMNIYGNYKIRLPVVLPYRLNKALVNLTRLREGDTLYDPFCGTGRILIEAGLMGIKGVGIDIDKKMVYMARENIYFNDLNEIVTVRVGDARKKNMDEMVDSIATDPPYGRSSSLKRVGIETLYRDSVTAMEETLRKNGYAVIVYPEERLIESSPTAMKIVNIFHARVHRSLTRHIAVYKRI